MKNQTNNRSISRVLQTVLAVVALYLLYAFAVQATEIDVLKLQEPSRSEQVTTVLRFLADPDVTDPDPLDWAAGAAEGPVETTEIFQDTLRLILETIFMALMATTIGTLLAVPVSFLAARNLMVDVTAPLAAIMLALIALPLGWLVGSWVTGQLVAAATALSAQAVVGLGSLVGVVVVGWLLARSAPELVQAEGMPRTRLGLVIGRTALLVLLAFFGLGLVAVLGSSAGAWLEARLGIFSFLGNFVAVVMGIIALLLAPTIGLLGALVAMSLGSRYGQEAVLRMPAAAARLVTAVLTVGGTAVLIYGMGAVLNWLYQFDNPAAWTTIPALVGGGIAGALSLLLSPKRPFAIGAVIYGVSRSILNVLRSIEPLIMAVVFVIWVGLGPFAGVMALTLHTIAALGKLFSEQIEGISEGPIEAITATGASRLQTIVYAVIPQIIPPYIAYTLYRWDINVRVSTILGFVGGGGIGFLLSQSIRLLRYREASVMMLAIAVVVSLLDYLSSKVRNRVI
ncbi:MAG: phosphonate ABC transporter, permease protein PhnE [Anaerolineales bacterium]|nr:phosphonate ABC transporter, permease protein PhnE [Anaerolineales bacterium]